MEYNKIIAVTGLPGLYELLSSKSDGAIVRSLDDKSTRFVSGRVHNFSHLESIEVYTLRDNVNLVDVLQAMETSSEQLPVEKDNAALKAYFTKVFPDLDFDRVYSSDLKKMVKWFQVLKTNNIEIKLSEGQEPGEEEGEGEREGKVEKTEDSATEVPVGENKKKQAVPEKEVSEEKPTAKKAAPKKKAEAEAKGATAEKSTTAEKEEAPAIEKPKKAAKKK